MIVVTGANGFVGRHVVDRLAKQGTPVRAMVRDAALLRQRAGVEVVTGDVTKPATLAAALRGADRIVHAAAITANIKEPYPGAYAAVNQGGMENVVAAAREAGVARIVLLSGYGTRPDRDGTYMATRWGMEEAVRNSGIPYAIVQPTVQFGDGAVFVSALAGLVRTSPVVPAIGSSRMRFQPVWVEDIVSAILRLLEDDALLGTAYPVGGAEVLTYAEIIQVIAGAMGKKRMTAAVPMFMARIQASLMSAVLSNPPLTPASLELFSSDNVATPDSMEKPFGIKPRGFTEYIGKEGLDS
jgi:uncharacterized protein YbjT (DUF2867 family)